MKEVDCKKIVLIPAYEPDDKLIELVKKLKCDVIVVNDGSNKDYDKIFDEVKKYAKVITYDVNKGKGYALKTGLKYIKDNYKNNYVIITMDCDGQHSINDLDKLYNYAKENKNTLVLGKRLRGDNTPLRSYLGNSITKFIYKIVTKKDIYDTQTGYRAFSNELIDYHLNIPGNRYEYEMNTLLYLNDIKIKEIEVETIYIENNKNSHFNGLKDSFRIYKQIIKFSSISIMSFLIDYIFYIFFNMLFNISLSNIFARVISATFNYSMNKRVVFNSKNSIYKSLPKYILLAIFILLFNTCILNLFVYFGLDKYISKIISELLSFVISFIIQKKVAHN